MSELQTEIPFVIINLLQVVDGWIWRNRVRAVVEEEWNKILLRFW